METIPKRKTKNTTLWKQFQNWIVSSGAGTAYLSRASEFTFGFQSGSCYQIFSLLCMFCRSLFVLLDFFFWPLCCLFFFDIRILITFGISKLFLFIIQLCIDILLSIFLRFPTQELQLGLWCLTPPSTIFHLCRRKPKYWEKTTDKFIT